MNREHNFCPCCGYHGLEFLPYSEMPAPPYGDMGDPPYIGRFGEASFGCCDCCGFEFGYDDDAGASGRACSFRQYRQEWITRQMPWFRPEKRPADWSLVEQLAAAGIQ